MTEKPLENSFWLVDDRILAGEYPGGLDDAQARSRIRGLLLAGFTHFLDLTEAREPTRNGPLRPYDHILSEESEALGITSRYQRMPIRDQRTPRTRAEMQVILDALDYAMSKHESTYLHCWGGVGRTGTVAGCYLSRRGDHGPAALDELRRRWLENPKSRFRTIPDNGEQERYVLGWREASDERR